MILPSEDSFAKSKNNIPHFLKKFKNSFYVLFIGRKIHYNISKDKFKERK